MLVREDIFKYVKNKYKTIPEYLWAKSPNHAVLRHSENNKWYAIVMNVKKTVLGLEGTDEVDIINVKCPTELIGAFRMENGILKGYHMNKEHWISLVLDGTLQEEKIFELLDLSFDITK